MWRTSKSRGGRWVDMDIVSAFAGLGSVYASLSRVRRKWSIDIGISRLISVGMRAMTFVLHRQVVRAARKSYNALPIQCVRLIHRRISPRSTHTCITRIDLTRLLCLTLRSRPPAAWTNTTCSFKLWNGEQRESSEHMLPSVQRARSTQAQTSACAALRRPSVCDDRRSALSGTHQKPSVSSLLRLRLVRLLFTNYQNLPSHLARTLRQYLLVTIESSLTDLLSFWTTFRSIKLGRPDESTPHGGCRVSSLCGPSSGVYRRLGRIRSHGLGAG